MIDKTEQRNAQRELLAQTGQKIKELGFASKPSGQSFYRTAEGGEWAFHISFIPHKSDFDFTADVAIRIDKVEDLVNKHDSKRSLAEQRKSMTLGSELGNLSIGGPIRWTVSTAEEISSACDEVVKSLARIGLPFLESHSDVASVHRVLTSQDPKCLLLAPILGPRYMRAVASAHLLGSIEELNALIPKYETRLRETQDLYLEDFLALCRDIRGQRGTDVTIR